MMRFATLVLIAWIGDALAQDRLEIEIVPVWVTDPLMQFSPSISELNDALSTLHQAMSVLGVRPNEYNLVLSEETEYLECSQATVLQAQTCSHERLGIIDISAEGWTESHWDFRRLRILRGLEHEQSKALFPGG